MRSVRVAFACVLTSFASAAAAEDSTQPGGAPKASAAAAPSTASAPKASPPKASPPTPKPAAAVPVTAPPAAGTAPVPAPTAPPAQPDTSAPPLYYVEPPAAPAQPEVFEPAPMDLYEPPPPPALPRNAPANNALWAGVRLGALIPFGALWVDGFNGYYGQRAFSDYASTGPVFELDVGARLARRYNLFALWEHTSLGKGNLDNGAFGGQERGATNLYGIGMRLSTEPSSIGFLTEIGLGYRDFRAYWSDGTKLSLTGGWFDARIGFGVDIRVERWLSLSPMVVLAGGSFDKAEWSGPGGTRNGRTPYDDGAQYGTVSFVLGAHADVF